MPGQGAARRANVRKARLKKQMQKEAKKAGAGSTAGSNAPLIVPTVTEDDLLAYQIAHFGDCSKPANWFVDAETALNHDPAAEEDRDLGYYEDGVKRTLTDEQIAMFRHTEIQMLIREGKMKPEDAAQAEFQPREKVRPAPDDKPVVDNTSDSSGRTSQHQPQSRRREFSSQLDGPIQRQRAREVPYDERHKRKWEHYVEDTDPVQGSMTHRRIVREMDEQRAESVDLDY